MVNIAEARGRIEELRHYNVFISLVDEEGDGPVVAIKDCIDVKGAVTTAGGILLPRVPADADAEVVANIRAAGCSIVGKASLHEYALGVTNENPHYGNVANPRAPGRVPGGSSGGSAAAVAAGMCDWAVGSDTGGSIRTPASLSGVVGLKPTIGTVSTDRVFPLAASLDTLGPLAGDVASAARALEIMSGRSGLVPSVAPDEGDLRLAVPARWVGELDAETSAAWRRVSQGLPEIPFPSLKELEDVFQPILFFEATSYHREWMETRPEAYGPDVLQLLRIGAGISQDVYRRSLELRQSMLEKVEAAMEGVDAVLLPTTPIVAPPMGAEHVRGLLLQVTRPFSLTGQPVVTLAVPVTGLPVGIQVIGHHGQDARLLEVALGLESEWEAAT